MTKQNQTQADLKSSLNYVGRKINTAILQTALTVPGTALNDFTLSALKYPGLEMFVIEGPWVMVKYKGKEVLIPSANFKNLIME